ncbi:MAG: hypothetical protein KatS3mg031_0376 [Chitinophagales bacterium]|nr:MAG: hypothetical protein KatS3mg031_0376 [Chitinophagales bacterium]
MSMHNFYVDIHCHPNLKAFNSGHPEPVRNMWERIEHPYTDNALTRLFRRKSNAIAKYSQSNLYTLTKGGVRVAIISLYPIEKGFLQFRRVPHAIFGGETVNDVLEHIMAVRKDRLVALQQQENHYFHELVREYEYVKNGQGKSPDNRYEYSIADNYAHLQEILRKPDTIALILSVEGAHALGCGNRVTENMTPDQLIEDLTRNIASMKRWHHPPFFINLAHHFWNQLCGHAPSIPFPFNQLVNQNKGMNEGITQYGWHVLHELLGRHNGKRILIDIKHMSVAARLQYYEYIRKHNRLNPRDKIPVIASHVGLNGYETMKESIEKRDSNRKSRNSYLHRRSINLSDEEVRIIHASGGLLGIMMDKGNLAGIKTLQYLSSIHDEEKKKEEWCRLIWTNIFQAIKAVKQRSAWDIIAIGTDYDGGISHVDLYQSAENMGDLEKDLITYLDKTKFHRELWYGYHPDELVAKIMRENSIGFLKAHFQ